MRKVLIASGCSWTDENFTTIHHPDMDCSWPKWPELLAEKLDMDYINLGEHGAGNEYIYSSLLHQIQSMDPDDIGLVIPAWTQAQRKDIKVRDVWQFLSPPKNELYSKSTKYYGDVAYRVQESIILFYSLQEICKARDINIIQFQMLPLFRNSISDQYLDRLINSDNTLELSLIQTIYDSPFLNDIDSTFIGWPTEDKLGGFNIQTGVINTHDDDGIVDYQYMLSDLDNHPNAEGHTKIAEYLYDNI